ncbi:MAG: ABC transporter permease [Bacteroidota bacterium]
MPKLLSRSFYGLVVLVLVTTIVSSIIYLTPVDPTRLTFGQRMDETSVALKREQYGLDLPLHRQVWRYLGDISPLVIMPETSWRKAYVGASTRLGDFRLGIKFPYLRESYQNGRPVSRILSEALPNTLYLSMIAIGLATVIGILLGITSSLLSGTWWDRLIVLLSTVGYSVPSYVMAIVLAVVFGYYLRDLTGLSIQGSLFELNDLGEDIVVLRNLILPAVALGIRPISIITQLTRSSMLQVMSEKYVVAARAKGLSRTQLIRDHLLKNALNPVITALSGWFASLLAGAFFVEFIFNFKGLGFVTVTALLNYDIPVILGALLVTCSLFIIVNIVVDLLYVYLDPRVELST